MSEQNDLISRQDAIDVAMRYCPDDDGTCSKSGDDLRNLLDDLEALPPAQEIIHCKDCIYSGHYEDDLRCFAISGGMREEVEPDDFCSYAERREESNDEIYSGN